MASSHSNNSGTGQSSENRQPNFSHAYQELLSWCGKHDFAGHDPFDALNSRVFQKTPLSRSRNARLAWTQLVKRSPSNLRHVARVPRQRNSKGIALFALALLANYRQVKTVESDTAAREMLEALLSMKLKELSGAAWGYNFDWQSRNFFAPHGSPTIVPTAFAARALIEAARDLRDSNYVASARSACDFIVKDLVRSYESDSELCFSYSVNSNTQIHNANLLAAEVLAEVGLLTHEEELLRLAERAARFVIRRQQKDGSWAYGTEPRQSWVDNFHTAFVLFSLARVIDACQLGVEFKTSLERGYLFWKENFFLADGWPKYYHDDPYPADAHAGASAIITFLELSKNDPEAVKLAAKVADWTINNLRDSRGFFYYQRRRFYTLKTPYMRWSQAWMLYALARLLEEMSDEL